MSVCPKCGYDPDHDEQYQKSVRWVRKTLRVRGFVWEATRTAIESGDYQDDDIQRMLAEGVIVKHFDPTKGYILPTYLPRLRR